MCSSSLSPSGSVLLGVGSDRQGRGSVVVWDVSAIVSSGAVQVAAQAHTDVSIRRMQLSSDCSRCSIPDCTPLMSIVHCNMCSFVRTSYLNVYTLRDAVFYAVLQDGVLWSEQHPAVALEGEFPQVLSHGPGPPPPAPLH